MTLKQLATSLSAAGLVWLAASGALAQDAPNAQEQKTPIMGTQLMTQEERDQYRIAMRALKTEEERAAMRARHHLDMLERAREQGVEISELPGPGGGPGGRGPRGKGSAARGEGRGQGRGRNLMTPEEREQFRKEMRSKTTDEERAQLRKENHEKMRERARERGIELPAEPRQRGGGGGRGQGQRQGQGQGQGGER
jgi:hypothetical protein